MKIEKENKFDIAVIGGGPAGIMSAITATKRGSSVVLLEKNSHLGKKLLVTGNGRCNIANAEFNLKKLIKAYKKGGGFLFNCFSHFGPQETIEFFNQLKVKTKVERGKRVFPESDKAETVLSALKAEMGRLGIVVVCEAEVHRIGVNKESKVNKIVLKNKKNIFADNYIIATGGLSYPVTGSTGSGLRWAKSMGHKIIEPKPALVPMKVKEHWIKDLQGLTLKNVELSFITEKKKIKKQGEVLFTHYGLTGPLVLEVSGDIGKFLDEGGFVKVKIDMKPALDEKKLDLRVRRDFEKFANKKLKNSLGELLPSKMIPVAIKLIEISPEKTVNKITKEERKRIVKIIKGLELNVESLMGFDLAIITRGGVCLSEIDEKTMRSRKIENLFFAGEALNIDGPTGGFNLQVAWSTGYLAGKSASTKK